MADPNANVLSGAPPDEKTIETVIGPQLAVGVYGLLRAARLYDVSNQAVRTQIHQLTDLLAAFGGEEVALLFLGEHAYVNGARVKPRPLQQKQLEALASELKAHDLGGLRFLGGLDSPEIEAFLRLMASVSNSVGAETLRDAAFEGGIRRVVFVPAREISSGVEGGFATGGPGSLDERVRARDTFWSAVTGTRSVFEETLKTQTPAMRHARRVVQPLVDTLMNEEYSIVGLSALKNHDEYTYAHCVNVSVLSIAIGHRFGLSRATLASLGVAALLHDLGKLAVPVEIFQKVDRLTPEEWRLIQRHPLEGVKTASRVSGLAMTTIDTMRVCLEHHQTLDGKGYPTIARSGRQSTLARIVAAADCYDAMTGHRSYRRRPMTGYEALQVVLGCDSSHFDPAVMAVLVRCVGLYPAGTVVVTKSEHTAISLGPNLADPRRPFCRVLARPGGERLAPEETTVWNPMPAAESVAGVLSPEEFEVDVEAQLKA